MTCGGGDALEDEVGGVLKDRVWSIAWAEGRCVDATCVREVVTEDVRPDPGEVSLWVTGGGVLIRPRRRALPDEPECALIVPAAKDKTADG